MRRNRTWLMVFVASAAFALPGCGKESSEEKSQPVKLSGAKVSLPTATNAIDTKYISNDFIGAAVLHPRRVLEGEQVKTLISQVENNIGKGFIEKRFAELTDQWGVDVRNVNQIIVLADRRFSDKVKEEFSGSGGRRERFEEKTSEAKTAYEKTEGPRPKPPEKTRDDCLVNEGVAPESEFGPEDGGEPLPSFIVRFETKVDESKVASAIARQFPFAASSGNSKGEKGEKGAKPPALPEVTIGGKKCLRLMSLVICFVDDKTVIGGPPHVVKNMLTAENVESPLTKRLSTLGAEHDVILAIAGDAFSKAVDAFAGEMRSHSDEVPPPLRSIPDLIAGMQSFALTFSVTSDPMLSLVFQTRNTETATNVTEEWRSKWLPMLTSMLPPAAVIGKEPAAAVKEFLDGVSVGSRDADLIVSLKRVEAMNKLPQLLAPAVAQAREAARRSQRKNNLKQIGIAMHNFHETYGHFPSHGSNGARKGTGRKEGLSWRVYLLPFLEESALYREFHLDEPWDSPHNKKLIPRMPRVFASLKPQAEKSGKTSIHVFVGPGTPFGGENGPRFRDMTDGTSNTIAAVEAGADKADAWTKPGGLPFDPKQNPVALLGNLGRQFLALMNDGSVRGISSAVSPETLRRLIQHNDNKVIKDPNF